MADKLVALTDSVTSCRFNNGAHILLVQRVREKNPLRLFHLSGGVLWLAQEVAQAHAPA